MEIIITWIAALISFFVLLADEFTIEYFWIPLVSFFVLPTVIWVNSWILYAFGEMVENISDIRDIAGRMAFAADNPSSDKKKKDKKTMASGKEEKPAKQNAAKAQGEQVATKKSEPISERDFFDVECPSCGETLSFKGNTKSAKCPWCDAKITIL